ncbi:MAG: hypothetical protein A2V83_02930 [Nitrospirae bacterium RBG_16_64_22]|nr:MAG: hypothetical protein A2V83_02930 [Nitrospirae bacterium RBG_16_64_22]
MAKKIAVLVTDRQGEALRMSVGLILLDDAVDVFVLGRKMEETEKNLLNFETMKEMDMNVYTNARENAEMKYLSTDEIAEKLAEYDHVLPY